MSLTPDNPVFTLNQHARARFGTRVTRIPLSLHHPCPNRIDGRAGCAFCLPESYEPPADHTCGSIEEQLARGIARHTTRADSPAFIAYFQSGSATAVPVDELVTACTAAARYPGVVAVSLATRPDCLPPDICAALAALARDCELWVELGVQTAHDRTLDLLGRNHSAACSLEAVRTLFSVGIQQVVLHMILGLPGETEEEMRESFRLFAKAGERDPGFRVQGSGGGKTSAFVRVGHSLRSPCVGGVSQGSIGGVSPSSIRALVEDTGDRESHPHKHDQISNTGLLGQSRPAAGSNPCPAPRRDQISNTSPSPTSSSPNNQISNDKSQISNISSPPSASSLGFKIHHLQVIKGTPLEQWWRAGRVRVYEMDDYARLVVDILEHVPEDIVIHRMLGSASAHHLCAPVWPGDKAAHLRRILDEFTRRGTRQGSYF